MRLRAVLFDWGDTLFVSPRAADVIVDAARERGVAIHRDAAQRLWDELWALGKTPEEHAKGRDLGTDAHREVWTALFRRADAIAPGIADALYERVMDPSVWTPYPDAGPTLSALRSRGLRTGIVSNVPIDLRPIFARHGLRDTIDAFVLSSERVLAKPDPRLFRLACLELGVAAAETLMVGDDPVSDGGAAAAGLEVLILPPAPAAGPRGLAAVLERVDRAPPA